jgi:hypothetical protein
MPRKKLPRHLVRVTVTVPRDTEKEVEKIANLLMHEKADLAKHRYPSNGQQTNGDES